MPTGTESLTLKVTATDTSGLSASETFGVTVPVAGPAVTDQTANQTWTQGQKISLVLPANTFTDPQGETLTYTASQASGQALPSWLSFNAATKTFSGTVPASVENLTLKVTAADTSHLAVSETFDVNVAAKAPTVTDQTANQTWLPGQKVSLTLPTNTFTDPQGQTLTYTASQSTGEALPSWLSFNATTRTFSGTAPLVAANLTRKVTATDASGMSAAETFGATVPAAAAPIIADQTANQTWLQGQKISLALPAKTFTDPQNETLTYTASQSNGQGLPSWLSFNATTKIFSGTMPTTGAQSLTLEVTATDASGMSADETFGVTVPAAVAPTISTQTANQTGTQGHTNSLALPAKTFTDPQGEDV